MVVGTIKLTSDPVIKICLNFNLYIDFKNPLGHSIESSKIAQKDLLSFLASLSKEHLLYLAPVDEFRQCAVTKWSMNWKWRMFEMYEWSKSNGWYNKRLRLIRAKRNHRSNPPFINLLLLENVNVSIKKLVPRRERKIAQPSQICFSESVCQLYVHFSLITNLGQPNLQRWCTFWTQLYTRGNLKFQNCTSWR